MVIDINTPKVETIDTGATIETQEASLVTAKALIDYSQPKLKDSGETQNIKTINGESIIGTGNLDVHCATDSAMSDSSTNAVQNKVIKAYVDGQVGDINTVLNSI